MHSTLVGLQEYQLLDLGLEFEKEKRMSQYMKKQRSVLDNYRPYEKFLFVFFFYAQ